MLAEVPTALWMLFPKEVRVGTLKLPPPMPINTEKKPIKLRNVGVESEEDSMYFDQYYTSFGRNVERLTIVDNENFRFKRVI